MSNPSEKPQDSKKVLIRLWMYLSKHKFLLALAIFMTIASNLLALVGPKLSGHAINAIGKEAGKVNFHLVFYYCFLMTAIYLLSSVLSYILSIVMINMSRRIVFRMRTDVFNRLAELPVGYYDRHQTGDIISHISYDIDTVNASLSGDLVTIATSVITVVGSFIYMVNISPPLVSIFVVTIPFTIWFTKYMTRRVRPMFRARSGKMGELNGFAEEVISGQKTVKVYHSEDKMIERFDVRNENAVTAYFNADYYGSMIGPAMNFINNLSLALISVLGAVLYMNSAISLGNLSAFILYSRKFSGPINEMANIISDLQSACAAAERVFHLIDEKPEPTDSDQAVELTDVSGDVMIENVSFGYTEGKSILQNVNLHAKQGSMIAIVGPTGAGKTTLINLLMRFYDTNTGSIMVDGKKIKEVTRSSLRKSFAMVLQDSWLFGGTIFENIAYGNENATADDVKRAAIAVGIHDYVMSLEDGYDTVLNEDGINISGGQKQLITIARAMLTDAKMLILDEATSNVDTATERKIQKAMRDLMSDKTCFVIAHRLSTVRDADLILVVMSGKIVEQGTHEQLMAKKGVYNELYMSQFD